MFILKLKAAKTQDQETAGRYKLYTTQTIMTENNTDQPATEETWTSTFLLTHNSSTVHTVVDQFVLQRLALTLRSAWKGIRTNPSHRQSTKETKSPFQIIFGSVRKRQHPHFSLDVGIIPFTPDPYQAGRRSQPGGVWAWDTAHRLLHWSGLTAKLLFGTQPNFMVWQANGCSMPCVSCMAFDNWKRQKMYQHRKVNHALSPNKLSVTASVYWCQLLN